MAKEVRQSIFSWFRRPLERYLYLNEEYKLAGFFFFLAIKKTPEELLAKKPFEESHPYTLLTNLESQVYGLWNEKVFECHWLGPA